MIIGFEKLIPYYQCLLGLVDIITENDDNVTKIESKQNKGSVNMDISLNTILYGPPGTGKTFNTKKYAVAICNYNGDLTKVNSLDYFNEIIPQYNKLVSEDRIAFTTFHQSYGYEEFIEGIKPILKDDESNDVSYDIVSGSFKKFCDNALIDVVELNDLELDENTPIWKMSLSCNL